MGLVVVAGAKGLGFGFGFAFEFAGDEDELKGFAFPDTLPVSESAPNKLAPRSCLEGCSFSCSFDSAFFGFSCSTLIFFVARRALILPGLRLQVLRQHPNIYRRLSWSAKCSGRSPFSSRRRCSGRLQTLQLAKVPGGGVDSSSHVCSQSARRCAKESWIYTPATRRDG